MNEPGAPAAPPSDEGRTPGVEPRTDRDPRLAGALIGAVLAGILLAAFIWFAPSIDRAELRGFGLVFGPDGILQERSSARIATLLVGMLSAAIAGWVLSVPAIRSVDWTGLWMGSVTYGLAILLSPIVVAVATNNLSFSVREITPRLVATPFVTLAAGFILAPLLGVCLVAGPAWASLLRIAIRPAGTGAAASRSLPIWPIVAGTLVVFAGWGVIWAMAANLELAPGLD